MKSSAILSEDRVYRYVLYRMWDRSKDCAIFIGLNPSTADETKNDPTIRRCMGFAKSWGYGSVYMLNLFAFRATDPDDLVEAEDPVGPRNDSYIQIITKYNGIIVAAWGNHGSWLNRDRQIQAMLPGLYHLGLTKCGQPKHPLYLSAATKPRLWRK